MTKALKVLFIPVSTPEGIGEYMRSCIIADRLIREFDHADVTFVLNKKVAYLSSCPYSYRLTNDTPTKDSKNTLRYIAELKPDIVFFDASGRAEQFRAAKQVGAVVCFLSQHEKKRARGLKLNRMFHTDFHWVVQPDFAVKPLSLWQKIKLSVFNGAIPKNIGAVFNPPHSSEMLIDYGIKANQYIVFNAGSGGHKINDELAANLFFRTAEQIARELNIKCVVVMGDNYPVALPKSDQVIVIKSIAPTDFISLMKYSASNVLSGGDSLLQAVALHVPTVAVPVAKDQSTRIAKCLETGLVFKADTSNIFDVTREVIQRKQNIVLPCLDKDKLALDIIIDDLKSVIS